MPDNPLNPDDEARLKRALEQSANGQVVSRGSFAQPEVNSDKASAWDEGFQAGWSEAKDPGAFVNDYWDSKTPNPYNKENNE